VGKYYGAMINPPMSGSPGAGSIGWGGRGGNGTSAAGGETGEFPVGNQQAQAFNLDLSGGGGGPGLCGNSVSGTSSGPGGGEGAPGIYIAAATLIRASTNAAGTIISTGGNGATSIGDLSGPSSGGGGGAVMLHVGALSGTVATNLLRSVGGNGATSNSSTSEGGYGGVCAYGIVNGAESYSSKTAPSGATGGTSSLSV